MQWSQVLSPNKYDGRIKPIRLIVIHDMEVSEVDTSTAENVANYFAKPTTRASAHVCVDVDSAVRCVIDTDTAWAAPGANADGLQVELAGFASQTREDWQDAASMSIMTNAAEVVAGWVSAWGIPVQHLSVDQIMAGQKGIVGHIDVTYAYHQSDHTDPGTGFPWDVFLGLVNQKLNVTGTAPSSPPPAPPTDTRPRNADGSLRIDEDGVRGPQTISRWQEVMGTPIDGFISTPQSTLIMADQRFLNRVVSANDILNLTGKTALVVDGDSGPKTSIVRQYWLRNAVPQQTQLVRLGHLLAFDSIFGPESNLIHQIALNHATTGTASYGRF